MKVLVRQRDLSPDYLRFVLQIGADGIDIHNAESVPGLAEQGYPYLEELRMLKKSVNDAGLEIYRVAPAEPQRFLLGEPGGDEQLDELVKTVEILGQVGIPFMSMPVHMSQTQGYRHFNPAYRGGYSKEHRGGYTMGGFDVERMKQSLAEVPLEPFSVEDHWDRCVQLYERLVPVAENHNVKLIIHPSDPPLAETEFSPQRWTDILEAVPSDHSGLLYCIGTRYEALGDGILDDIRHWGGKGKIFHTHFRNVQGNVPEGGYCECALDDGDGDMNMFAVLRTLREIGFNGGLQMDHLPNYTGDGDQRASTAYAVGYAKAMVKALEA
jgi:mannonate dehydratase